MALPMMPKATAVWLVDNTALTFMQISEFCGLHELEIQAIADEEVAIGMTGLDPIGSDQLTPEEIARCEADPTARLKLAESNMPVPVARTKGARYTPVSKRQDKPDAIDWLLRNRPELSDAQIGRLLGTTKTTISAVRDRTHWNTSNIRPRDPLELGMVSRKELEAALEKARRRVERAEKAAAKKEKAAPVAAPVAGPAAAPAEGETPAAAPAESETPAAAPTEVEAPAAAPTESEAPAAAPAEVETPAAAPTEVETPAAAPAESEAPAAGPAESETPAAAPAESEAPAAAPAEGETPAAAPAEGEAPPVAPVEVES